MDKGYLATIAARLKSDAERYERYRRVLDGYAVDGDYYRNPLQSAETSLCHIANDCRRVAEKITNDIVEN